MDKITIDEREYPMIHIINNREHGVTIKIHQASKTRHGEILKVEVEDLDPEYAQLFG